MGSPLFWFFALFVVLAAIVWLPVRRSEETGVLTAKMPGNPMKEITEFLCKKSSNPSTTSFATSRRELTVCMTELLHCENQLHTCLGNSPETIQKLAASQLLRYCGYVLQPQLCISMWELFKQYFLPAFVSALLAIPMLARKYWYPYWEQFISSRGTFWSVHVLLFTFCLLTQPLQSEITQHKYSPGALIKTPEGEYHINRIFTRYTYHPKIECAIYKEKIGEVLTHYRSEKCHVPADLKIPSDRSCFTYQDEGFNIRCGGTEITKVAYCIRNDAKYLTVLTLEGINHQYDTGSGRTPFPISKKEYSIEFEPSMPLNPPRAIASIDNKGYFREDIKAETSLVHSCPIYRNRGDTNWNFIEMHLKEDTYQEPFWAGPYAGDTIAMSFTSDDASITIEHHSGTLKLNTYTEGRLGYLIQTCRIDPGCSIEYCARPSPEYTPSMYSAHSGRVLAVKARSSLGTGVLCQLHGQDAIPTDKNCVILSAADQISTDSSVKDCPKMDKMETQNFFRTKSQDSETDDFPHYDNRDIKPQAPLLAMALYALIGGYFVLKMGPSVPTVLLFAFIWYLLSSPGVRAEPDAETMRIEAILVPLLSYFNYKHLAVFIAAIYSTFRSKGENCIIWMVILACNFMSSNLLVTAVLLVMYYAIRQKALREIVTIIEDFIDEGQAVVTSEQKPSKTKHILMEVHSATTRYLVQYAVKDSDETETHEIHLKEPSKIPIVVHSDRTATVSTNLKKNWTQHSPSPYKLRRNVKNLKNYVLYEEEYEKMKHTLYKLDPMTITQLYAHGVYVHGRPKYDLRSHIRGVHHKHLKTFMKDMMEEYFYIA